MNPELSRDSVRNGIVIQTRELTRRFGRLAAVDRLDLEINRGEIFGFLGPNGAGKSTLMRLLVGLLAPTEGTAEVLGCHMPKHADRLRSRIGYMTQKFSLYDDLSVEENLEFAAQIFGLPRGEARKRIDHILDEFALEERRKTRPAVMSGGWKQRLALAASTIHQPEILLLDEPTAGVDPSSRRHFWEMLFELSAQGTTILVSTHYMDEAVRCHRLCMMREGRRTALGAPDALTAELKDRIVEISAQPADAAMNALRTHPDVISGTQLGHVIHVLLKPSAGPAAEAVDRLRRHLRSAGLDRIRGRAADPSLEDVFVAQTHGEVLNK